MMWKSNVKRGDSVVLEGVDYDWHGKFLVKRKGQAFIQFGTGRLASKQWCDVEDVKTLDGGNAFEEIKEE